MNNILSVYGSAIKNKIKNKKTIVVVLECKSILCTTILYCGFWNCFEAKPHSNELLALAFKMAFWKEPKFGLG